MLSEENCTNAEGERFIKIRYLDPNKEKGTEKKFYKPEILNELDKHYDKT